MDMAVCNKALFIKIEVGWIWFEGLRLPTSFLEIEPRRFLPWGYTHKSVDNMRNSVGLSLSRQTGYFSRHICEHPEQDSFNFAILLPARLATSAASTNFNW